MITDPRFAPARSDIAFLRKRVRPRKPEPPPAAPAVKSAPAAPSTSASPPAPSQPSGPKIDYTRHRAPEPPPPPAPARPAQPVPPAQPARPAQPAPTSSLDLSSPPQGTPSHGSIDYRRSDSSSLDLSDPPPAAPAPARRTPPPEPSAWQRRHVTRVGGRNQLLMSVQEPTVTLTRVQSGIGQLTVEAICSPEVGDLRLGAAYQLRSGGTGIVQQADGSRFGPSARRPVIVGSREEYERLGIDLRQMTDVERIAVYAYSESRAQLTWGGTLVVTLVGGARLELPLEKLYPGPIAMLMTFYNLDGELVARAEMENVSGDVREAARAYGFDRITWRDERTPI